MVNEVTINDVNRGANVHIKGDVKFSEVETLVQSCSDGACDCSPDMLQKIDSIDVNGKDGDVTIALAGKALQADDIESCMDGCACGF